MATRHVFLLNLDADLELGARGRYAPTRAVVAAMDRVRATLIGTLVPTDGFVAETTSPPGAFEGYVGHAFAPTRSAVERLARLGASVAAAPSHEVLREVARREFGYLPELPDALVSSDADAVLEHLHTHAERHDAVRLKRSFGMSGRGHRVVRGRPTAADEAFVRASAPDSLIVEPELRIRRELALHGHLSVDGSFVTGEVCVQTCDQRGAFVGIRRLASDEAPHELREALSASLAEAAAKLAEAGYFGPFGIDAFEYETEHGMRLRTRSEIHARYSMGWATGMGTTRPDLAALPPA